MKIPLFPSVLLFCGLGLSAAYSQGAFVTGSDGSYGAINVTADTALQIPPDGRFHCTTITVATGKTLRFTRNSRNTPVYMLATGDVQIAGTITVSGSAGKNASGGIGGPGGFDGGRGAIVGETVGGWGYGPGGGAPGIQTGLNGQTTSSGTGGFGTRQSNPPSGALYGNTLLIPIIGGSGGGGRNDRQDSGGGGGGAILIASPTQINLSGIISSNAGDSGPAAISSGNGAASGSGGAIRLVAPEIIGSGSCNVVGLVASGSVAGDGRVRLDCVRRTGLNVTINPTNVGSIGGNLFVEPPNLPVVEITEVAGIAVDPAAAAAPVFMLPVGSAPSQPVKVRVRNFGGTARLQITLTPEAGARVTAPLDVVNPGPDAVEGTVNVTFPTNVLTRVDAWTR